MRDFNKKIERMHNISPKQDTISTHQTDLSNPMATEERLRSILPRSDPANVSFGNPGGCSDPIPFGARMWIVMEHFEDSDPTVTFYSNFRGLFFPLEAATAHMHRLIRADHPKTYQTAERYLQRMKMSEIFDSSAMPLGLGYRYLLGPGRRTRVLWLQQELWSDVDPACSFLPVTRGRTFRCLPLEKALLCPTSISNGERWHIAALA